MVSFYKLLSESLCSWGQSRSGHKWSRKSPPKKCYYLFWQERARLSRHSFYPLSPRSWLRGHRSQLAAPSGFSAQAPPTCHHRGSRVPNPPGPQAPQGPQAAPADRVPGRLLPSGCRGGDGREVCHGLKAWTQPVGGLGEGSGSPAGHSPEPVPWATAHPPVQGQVSQRAREKAGIHLLSSSPPQDYNSTEIDWPTNGRCLTVIHLGEGPTAAPANGWAGPLTGGHWQLLSWGMSPLQVPTNHWMTVNGLSVTVSW